MVSKEIDKHVRSQRAKYNELSRISKDPEIMIEKCRQDHKIVTENEILNINYVKVAGEDQKRTK